MFFRGRAISKYKYVVTKNFKQCDMTVDGVWIGNWIWLLKHMTTSNNKSSWIYIVYNSLEHTLQSLVMASSGRHSPSSRSLNFPHASATGIPSWLLNREDSVKIEALCAIQDGCLFTNWTELLPNRSSKLWLLGTDCQRTLFLCSSISVWSMQQLPSVVPWFAELLLSNGWLNCCLLSGCFLAADVYATLCWYSSWRMFVMQLHMSQHKVWLEE
jgi:hypothetical protein